MKQILKMVVLSSFMLISTQSFAETSKNVTKSVDNTVNQLNGQTSNVVNKTSSGIDRVYTDGTNAVGVVYNDLKSFGPKVEESIKELAKGLKVGTQYVWGILVKQQQVWSWCYLLGFILSALTWLRFNYCYKKSKEEAKNNDNEWSASNLLYCLGTLIIAITLSLLSFQHLEAMMTGFINPEFGAIRNIVQIASQLK
jgi:hypothetical protein